MKSPTEKLDKFPWFEGNNNKTTNWRRDERRRKAKIDRFLEKECSDFA